MAVRRRVPGNEFIVDETTHKQRPVRRRVTFESRGSRSLGSADLALYLFNSRGSDSARCTQARKTTRGLDGHKMGHFYEMFFLVSFCSVPVMLNEMEPSKPKERSQHHNFDLVTGRDRTCRPRPQFWMGDRKLRRRDLGQTVCLATPLISSGLAAHSTQNTSVPRLYDTIRYQRRNATIRGPPSLDAAATPSLHHCTIRYEMQRVSLIYRTEPTTKKCKTEKKLKVENRYAQK